MLLCDADVVDLLPALVRSAPPQVTAVALERCQYSLGQNLGVAVLGLQIQNPGTKPQMIEIRFRSRLVLSGCTVLPSTVEFELLPTNAFTHYAVLSWIGRDVAQLTYEVFTKYAEDRCIKERKDSGRTEKKSQRTGRARD